MSWWATILGSSSASTQSSQVTVLAGSEHRPGDGAARQPDDWSDLDLLVVVHDDHHTEFVDPAHNTMWSTSDLIIDARRNAPAGANSVATRHLRSGLPVLVDWYVYPRSMAAWPEDCKVWKGGAAARRTHETFEAWNGHGPRNLPLAISHDEQLQARLAMVPIAGKYIARRSSAAAPMLEFPATDDAVHDTHLGSVPTDMVGVGPGTSGLRTGGVR
jgi:hypothetical protein